MQQKKVPMRKCIGCNEMKPKKELVRIVKSPEGEISVDLSGKKNGRGTYICPCADCLKKAQKGQRIEKAFSCRIDAGIYDALLGEIENG